MCGHPLHESAFPGIGLNSKGLPKSLGPILPLINGDKWDKRFVLSMLSISRAIPCRGTVSTQEIEDPGKPVPQSTIDDLIQTLYMLNWRIDRPVWTRHHYSLKAGPNGQAMMGSIFDAHHLSDDDLENLRILGSSDALIENIKSIRSNISIEAWNNEFHWKDKSLLRKLSTVSDPEAKERVIAILDYWSQTALKPLHDSLMRFLKKIPGDLTYNQLGSQGVLPKTGPYYSMDLHAATDTFPVLVQTKVLEVLVGSKEYAQAWEAIMVGKPFATSWGPPVKYGRGQPIGAYSSWAMFAITHHLVVRTAARLAGYNPYQFDKYCLLGDDIVIADTAVAEIYKELMSSLGVTLSPTKTHVSDDTWEFAKRWYQAGDEISGIQLKAFMEVSNWAEAGEILRTSLSRWSIDPLDMEPRSISQYLQSLGQRPRDCNKVLRFLHLPLKADTEEVKASKSEWLASSLLQEVFGCFPRHEMKKMFILTSLGEIKASLMESGIKKVFAKGQNFMSALQASPILGSLDQSLLVSLPPVSAVRSEMIELQDTFNKMKELYMGDVSEIYLGQVMLSMSDPSRILAKRSAKMVIGAKASIVNKYKFWTKDYLRTRSHLLSDDSAPQ